MKVGTDLDHLLKQARPVLDANNYVFVSVPATYGDHADWQPIASFTEDEGLTLVVRLEVADGNDLHYDGVFRRIAFQVNSSLAAVGFTAAFTERLAAAGISANVFAGFHHDHVFVPSADAERAMAALSTLPEAR